jgi:hypothetical protein
MCPLAARSEAWVCGRSLAEIPGLNPAGDMDVCLFWVLCVVRYVPASGPSLVQRSPTECCVSECDREASIIRRSWHTRAVALWGGGDVC